MAGFRTYIVAALVAVFGALAVVDWNAFLTDPKAGWVALVTGVLMAIMRSVTKTPPGTPAS